MGRGYSGSDAILDLKMEYEYQGHIENEFQSIANLMELNLKHATRDLSSMSTDFELIKDNMVQLARGFLAQNLNYESGTLYQSVKGEVKGQQITLSAPARDGRGHLYAGHIEYGFTDRSGKPRGPWPFLRPAAHLAAMDSRGVLGDRLAAMLLYGPDSDMHNSMGRLSFGRTGNYISKSAARGYARDTKTAYGNWNKAFHGIRSDSDSPRFIYNGNLDWDWGSV